MAPQSRDSDGSGVADCRLPATARVLLRRRAEQLVQELSAAWNEHDPERLDPVFTEDEVYEDVAAGDTYTGLVDIEDCPTWVFTWFAAELQSRQTVLRHRGAANEP